MKNNIYENNADIKKMQQDAIRRVKELQSKAKINIKEEAHNNPQGKNKSDNKNSNKTKKYSAKLHRSSQPIDDVFNSILKDKDKNILLLLILILVGEDADSSLILALLYIML